MHAAWNAEQSFDLELSWAGRERQMNLISASAFHMARYELSVHSRHMGILRSDALVVREFVLEGGVRQPKPPDKRYAVSPPCIGV